jgi:hypothetical protein
VKLDTRYIDADLSVTPDGIADNPGLIEGPEPAVELFGDVFPKLMVPRSEWAERCDRTEAKRRATTRHIYSQGRTSACVGFGVAQAVETTGTRRYGAKHAVQLAGMDVYKRIGNTLMSGAMISDGMEAVADDGVLPLDTPENRDRYPATCGLLDYSIRTPPNAAPVRQLFRVTRWARCKGADEVMSALLAGFTGVVGRSRHCVPYCYPVHDGGSFYAAYANSWGDWGDDGWGYDSQRTFDGLTFFVVLDVAVRPDLEIPAP